MKTLETVIRKNGFTYTQVLRTNGVVVDGRPRDVAIYAQRESEDGNPMAYEAFRIGIGKATIFHGKEIPEREVFPGDECFGKTAWTFLTLEDAYQKLNLPKLLSQSGYIFDFSTLGSPPDLNGLKTALEPKIQMTEENR